MSGPHPLDDAAGLALRGPHQRFAVGTGGALRYRRDVGPFATLDDVADPQCWADLAAVVEADDRVAVPRPFSAEPISPPAGWTVSARLHARQMVAPSSDGSASDGSTGDEPVDADGMVSLGTADVDDLMQLTDATRPGPFGRGTVELGGYLGYRRDGRLAAMAGRRMRLPGWTEISAVCTHPDFRGQGLSRRLITAVAAGIHRDGDDAFLHVMHDNVSAIRLYESMGFTHRADVMITVVAPDPAAAWTEPPPLESP